MAKISQVLDAALAHHRSGNLAEAERLYREILEHHARHADAWHLLGLVDYSRGDFQAALDKIGRAIEIDASQPTFHNHFAEAYRALGRLEPAEASCRRAIGLKPEFAIAHNTLGTILDAQGEALQAMAAYRRAIELNPDFAQAHYNLAMALRSQGDAQQAEASFRRALAAKPDYSLAEHNLGALLQSQSRLMEAAACYEHILTLEPDNAEAHANLGSVLKDQGRAAEAIQQFERALAINPRIAEAHFNLGVICQDRDDSAAAVAAYRAAIDARPEHAEALSNLGTVLKSQGNFAEAMQCYERALAEQPDLAEAHRNRALLWLLVGDYERGWPEYEWRWRVSTAKPPAFSQPRWRGQPLDGGTMLLKSEQGLGDAIQFIRYAPLVKMRSNGRVLLQGPAALDRLLRGAAGVDRYVVEAAEEPFDCYLPVMSLPEVFGTTIETIPADVPYLRAEPERVEHWRSELARHRVFKVGIAWQGNPGYAGDALRSVPLAEFAPLAACEGVRLFSLQKRHGCEQLPAVAERFGIVDLGKSLDEDSGAFVDTAAVMHGLDLVITSDTAIAHLAGALGVPVWVALAFVPDWRWLLAREDSPWYPTMRLFRQARPGDWAGVFARVATKLRSLASA